MTSRTPQLSVEKTPRAENLLRAEKLWVELPSPAGPRRVIDGFDFEIAAGECVALVGPSGCGKTMFVSSCLQLLPRGARAGGTLQYQETDLLRSDERQLCALRGARLASIPQEPAAALDPVQRVGPQVAEVLRIHGLATPEQARARALEMLAWAGLPNPEQLWNEAPHRLSGGMRQRVAIAAALVAMPSLVFADEPTASLDAPVRLCVLDLLDRLRAERGMAVVLISHQEKVVAARASRIVVMERRP